MKIQGWTSRAVACLLAIMFVAAGCSKSDDDNERVVREAFNGYLDAVLDKDGNRGAELLSEDVREYYDELRDLALAGHPTEIDRQPIFSKLAVTMVRVAVPVDTLQAMDGRDLMIMGIDEGWTDATAVAREEIREIVVHEDFDLAEVTLGNEITLEFRREQNKWRLDFTSLLPLINRALLAEARKLNLSPNRFVFKAVGAFNGTRVTRRIWSTPEIKT
jgi:hypothetical protein